MSVNRQKAAVEDFEEPLEMKVSSGNIFADLGFEDAAVHMVKAGLVVQIDRIIEERGLTQKAAAEAMGIDPSKLAEMLVGHYRGYPLDLLMRHLVSLGVDVEIVVKPKAHEAAELRVA